jgi:hypothetical protein
MLKIQKTEKKSLEYLHGIRKDTIFVATNNNRTGGNG